MYPTLHVYVSMCILCVHRVRAHTTRVCHVHVYLCVPASVRLPTGPPPTTRTGHQHVQEGPANWSAPRHVVAFMSRCMTLYPHTRSVILTRTGHRAARVSCMLCVCTLSCILSDTQKIPLCNMPRSDRVFSEYAQSRCPPPNRPTRPYP